MFPRPRYHTGKRWTGEHGNEIPVLAGALARLLDGENAQRRWRMALPRTPQRFPHAGQWMALFNGNQRGERNWSRRPPRAHLRDSRRRVLPRRGPPMVVIGVPRRYQHGQWEARHPRGNNPRGPLRGGPERSANDLQRNPRGGLCGGPARSANEPQTQPKTSQVKTNGGRARKGERDERPILVTVDKNGRERKWGRSHKPLHGKQPHTGRRLEMRRSSK